MSVASSQAWAFTEAQIEAYWNYWCVLELSANSSPLSVPVQFFDVQLEHTEGTSEHEAEGKESSVNKIASPAQAPRSEFAIWLERKISDVQAEDPIRALLLLDVKVCSQACALTWASVVHDVVAKWGL
jgi:hypothetical protein